MFELQIKAVVNDTCNVAENDQKIWHDGLGHVNLKEIKNMSDHNVVNGLKIKGKNTPEFLYEASVYGKQTRLPFHKSISSQVMLYVALEMCFYSKYEIFCNL